MRLSRKPRMMKIGANAVSLNATNWAVIVVPMLDPMMTPRLCLNEMIPALTSPTAITVVAVLDWMMAVINVPDRAPINRLLVNSFKALRKVFPATWRISLLKCSIPYRKRISPGTAAKIISQSII